MNKKIIITLCVIIGALYALGNAAFVLNLTFPDINVQSLQDKFSIVHFDAPGNDFVGSIFRLASKSVDPTTIHLGAQSKTCTKLVRGLYFNSQRGKRVRPLDSDTLNLLKQQSSSYDDLSIDGGRYTTCDQNNPYSIFGSIRYVIGGVTGYLVAGTKLDYQQNKIRPQLAHSFQYFDNKVPLGYIYDSNGGIGFVGGELSGDENLIEYLNSGGNINSGFTYSGSNIISSNSGRETNIGSGNNAMETLRNLIIEGSVGLSKSIDEAERLSLLGNFQNKTVIYNGSDINSSTLINFAKQKAQELCQGKDPYTNLTLQPSPENIICIQNQNLTIDLTAGENYNNKTIIVKSGNVILQGGMQENSPALDLFLDRGLLYLPTSFTNQAFNDQGFPSTTNTINSGLFLRGNFIINGLVLGGGMTGFDHKLHLQGKMTTLNTPLEPTSGRTGQIETMFGSSTYDYFINLQNIFVRQCGLNGIGNDGTPCGTGSIISTTPIVILNGNYPSNILQ